MRIWMAGLLLAGAGFFLMWTRGGEAEPPGGGSPPAGGAYKKHGGGRGQKGEKGDGGGRRGGGPTPVVAVRVRKGDIGVYYPGLGTVTPIYTVTVRSRVDGQLMKIYYHEGDIVRAGDKLVEIDPRPFQVQLEQAEGQLMRDRALLENARVDLARYEKLLAQNAIQEQLYATQKATVHQLEGTVKTDQGAVDSAKLNITYSTITAPIAGRIGLRLIDPGNIVHASDANGLLVITQIQPISALFTIAEDQLPSVSRKLAAHQKLKAGAYDREDHTQIAEGVLSTVDNQIDPSTGTLRLRALFDNKSGRLFPNQFVNIRLLVETRKGVTLLPTAAIQRTTTNKFVYVVKPDSTVTVRPIQEGVTEGEETEITSGLSAGEVVVMTGVDRLEEGSAVRAQIAGEQSQGAAEGKRP